MNCFDTNPIKVLKTIIILSAKIEEVAYKTN